MGCSITIAHQAMIVLHDLLPIIPPQAMPCAAWYWKAQLLELKRSGRQDIQQPTVSKHPESISDLNANLVEKVGEKADQFSIILNSNSRIQIETEPKRCLNKAGSKQLKGQTPATVPGSLVYSLGHPALSL